MQGPHLREWEDRLEAVLARIDVHLEEKYGDEFRRHPARPAHGTTANPAYSGLFDIGTNFTLGYGSEKGEGYVLKIRLASLERIPEDFREQIEDEVVDMLQEELPGAFPDRELTVSRDGTVYKIHGDLGLG